MVDLQFASDEATRPAAALFDGDAEAGHFDPDLEKCRDVWRRVLVESITDYLFKRSTSQDWKGARDWLFYGQPQTRNSFEAVCGYLGLPPNKLRPMVASLRTACQTRPDRIDGLLMLLSNCGILRKVSK